MKAIALLLLLLASTAVAAPRDRAARVAYVARALAAVRDLGADGRAKLDRDVYEATRTRCAADRSVRCAIDAARAPCEGAAADRAACLVAADVIATNLRSVGDLVDDAARARLVRGSTDYHGALAAALRARYALLAAELAVADASASAAAIDRLCAERDRALHACEPGDAGCIPSLAYPRCVAALIWFVGGAP